MAAKKGKTYRTASGQTVDFGALLLANETAPAIGNMNVNARGDEIDSSGNITKSREQIMREYNELNTMVPKDDIIPEGTNIAVADDDWQDWEPNFHNSEEEKIENVQETESETVAKQEQPVEEEKPVGTNIGQMIEQENPATEQKIPTGGLAAAVAASKKVNTLRLTNCSVLMYLHKCAP